MGERIRSVDWSCTPLGAVGEWPSSLRTCVQILLASRQPMFVWWGADLINIYNDAFKAIAGGKHPEALGQPARQAWHDEWERLGPIAEAALQRNAETHEPARPTISQRDGYQEEIYLTSSWSPVPDDEGGVGGVLCASIEDTQTIVGERQMMLLRDLAARTGGARSVEAVCERAAASLGTNPRDLPFALFYLTDAERRSASLVSSVGIADGHPAAPPTLVLEEEGVSPGVWPMGQALRSPAPVIVAAPGESSEPLPTGAWHRSPSQVAVLSLTPAATRGRAAVLVAGLNPHRRFDEGYRGFLELCAGQISAAIARVEAAQALASKTLEAEAASRAKDEFLAMLGHELRNPLAPITTALQLMQLRGGDSFQKERTIIDRQVKQLVRLVDDLLEVSRIARGKITLERVRIELGNVLARALETTSPLIEQREHHLTVDVAPGLAVDADPARLAQVFANLLTNAAKFTPPGGNILVSAQRDGDTLTVSVRDSGIGIRPEVLPRIFDLFVQERQALDRSQGGLGLGLTIVRSLVELHGGTVEARSAGPGRGAELLVRLRRAHEERARETPGTAARRRTMTPHLGISTARARRVLVVDDNEDAVDSLAEALLELGHSVETARDGAAALGLLQRFVPDVVFLDIGLPVMDGYELARRIRGDRRFANTTLVALTGYGQKKDLAQATEAGFDAHLIKPVDIRAIEKIIAERGDQPRQAGRPSG